MDVEYHFTREVVHARRQYRTVRGPRGLGAGLAMKVREVHKLIEADGWFLVATRGSHRQFKHSSKPGRVTVAGKPGDDLAPGTLNSVLKQAGLKERR